MLFVHNRLIRESPASRIPAAFAIELNMRFFFWIELTFLAKH